MPEGWGDLEQEVAEARVAAAAQARSRRHWLRRQLDAEATMRGVALDLAERRDEVTVHTTAGGRHRGRITTVGLDHLALGAGGAVVLVPFWGCTAVHTSGDGPAGSGHSAPGERAPRLGDTLSDLAASAADVAVGVTAAPIVRGRLVAFGQDVLTVALAGPSRATVYVSLPSLAEVSVFGSG